MKTLRLIVVACFSVLLLFVGVSCSGSSESSVGDEVDFSGSYAVELKDIYDNAKTDFAKKAVEDSKITEQEYVEGLAIIEECYEANNATVKYDKYGFEEVTVKPGSGAEASEVMSKCAFADDGIKVYYEKIRSNPDNVDLETAYADCLVRVGLVAKGYTRDDFIRDTSSGAGSLPWNTIDGRYEGCIKDPYGLVASE